jgi:hypothetical protein
LLLQDIVASTEAVPQRSTWFGRGADQRRRLLLLTAAMLATLLVGGALAMGLDPSRQEPPPARVHQIEGPLEVGRTYWVDPDYNTSTPLRVTFTVPADGWIAWVGTYKDINDQGFDVEFGDEEHDTPRERISINIIEVTNLTADACHDHGPRKPAVGPSVGDLAEALTELSPFEVASAPRDVTAYGYRGKHLVLRIPDDMVATEARFEGCIGNLRSWMARVLGEGAFFGYQGPGDTEEYWILNVEGTRLVISVLTTAGTSQELIAEKQAVLDSIVIVP